MFFSEYEPNNLLLRQAYKEVLEQQMEEARLRDMLERIQQSKIIITFPANDLHHFVFLLKWTACGKIFLQKNWKTG